MQFSRVFSFGFTLLILLFSVCKALDCANPPQTITVSQSGGGNFKTIQSAVDSLPANNTKWVHIKISPGVYRETVIITRDKSCLYFEGAGTKSTIVNSNQPLTEYGTFASKADYTVAKGITFINTYNNPVLQDQNNPRTLPAEAARIEGDKCAFFQCAFLGVQDTLYDYGGRHYFHNCYIQGAVDFIFGDGQSIYEDCTIYFSAGKYSPPDAGGFIAAQKRDSANDTSGFVFKNCNITGHGKGNVLLGRGYRPYSRVIVANSFLGDLIKPEGWDAWKGAGQERDLTFVEEGNTGPGANKSKRVPWMKNLGGKELDQFLNMSYIDNEGWIAKLPTGIS